MFYFWQFFKLIISRIFLQGFIKTITLPKNVSLDKSRHFIVVSSQYFVSDQLAIAKCLKNQGIEHYQLLHVPKKDTAKAQQNFNNRLAKKQQQFPNNQTLCCSVFWGRAPKKSQSLWQIFLSDSWAVPGMLRHILMVLFNIRRVSCYFGEPLAQSDNACADILAQRAKHKSLLIGPDLSHRRVLSRAVLQSDAVQAAILDATTNENERKKLNRKAQKYLNEIASDVSYSVMRFFDIFLSWLWQKLYQGIEIKGMEQVIETAKDQQIVYVPCHRSHIDYLLLSYVIYHQGLNPPHIAAGINLNLPIVGSLLRRGGGFFIRRQFRDNKLYRAVLESYLASMSQQGFAIEYFIEGGRSRTGFLLPPKAGMLAMTLRASRKIKKPIAFIPVYIGYERLMESHSYINELYGNNKQKETLGSLLSARRFLKEKYGKVFVSMGKPITVDRQNLASPEQPDFFEQVQNLSQNIQTEINQSAYLSPLNFIATALLGSEHNAMLENQLLLQINLLQAFSQASVSPKPAPFNDFSNHEALSHGQKLGLLQCKQHSLGNIYYLDQAAQISATFLRNNTLHVFILPSLIASILLNSPKASMRRIKQVCLRLYPFLKAEFFLPWNENNIGEAVNQSVAILITQNIIEYKDKLYHAPEVAADAHQNLLALAGIGKASFERFYITSQIVISAENNSLNREELEQHCIQTAEHLSMLHQFHAPDFFDKNLFRTFIDSLLQQGILQQDKQQKLHYDKRMLTAQKLDKYVLKPNVKHSILNLTQNPTG